MLQELNATQFNITGTRVTGAGLDVMAGRAGQTLSGYSLPRVAAKAVTGKEARAWPHVQCPSILFADEIMSQFPSSKETAGEQKEDQSEDKKRPSL